MKVSKKGPVAALVAVVLALPGTSSLGQSAAVVTDLGFNYASGKSTLELSFDKEVSFKKSEVDNQVIIDVPGAKIDRKWAQRIDTSQHKSNVSLISPYQAGDVVRVVLQLKEKGAVDVSQDGSKIIASIDNMYQAPEGAVAPEAVAPVPAPPEGASSITTVPAGENGDADASLNRFVEAQKTKNYVGKKITLQLRDTELVDVFTLIGQSSEFNIILTDAVRGKVTVELIDVPWDQAVDLILQNNKLAAERYGNVLRITTLEALTKEKELELAAAKTAEASEPLVTKVFPVSYANINDMKKIIEDFLSIDNATPTTQSNVQSSNIDPLSGRLRRRGTVQLEERTNSLIVRDTARNIESIKRVLRELDTQTPQILIEAKFVEVGENKLNQLSGRIFATSREFTSNAFSFNNSRNNFGAIFNGVDTTGIGTGFSLSPSTAGASFGFMPKAALLPGLGEIGAFLQVLETESSVKVISSPRVVTQNKQAATISQGQVIQLATSAGANAPGTFQTITATLSLSVTPQITNDGGVLMNINFNQNSPAASSIQGAALTTNSKSVTTNVLVDSGATLVLGGVYVSTENRSAEGIPILRELPLIGPFFGSKGTSVSKGELFIFVTPRILNPKEAGLQS